MCAAPRGWNEHDEWIITLTPGLRGTGRVATTDVRSLKNGVEPMLELIRAAAAATQHIHRRRAAHAGRNLSESQHCDLTIIGVGTRYSPSLAAGIGQPKTTRVGPQPVNGDRRLCGDTNSRAAILSNCQFRVRFRPSEGTREADQMRARRRARRRAESGFGSPATRTEHRRSMRQ